MTSCLFILNSLSSSVRESFIQKLSEAVKRSQTQKILKNCLNWMISVTVMDVNEAMDALNSKRAVRNVQFN